MSGLTNANYFVVTLLSASVLPLMTFLCKCFGKINLSIHLEIRLISSPKKHIIRPIWSHCKGVPITHLQRLSRGVGLPAVVAHERLLEELVPSAQDVALQVALRCRDVQAFRAVPALRAQRDRDLGQGVGRVPASEAVKTEVARREALQD